MKKLNFSITINAPKEKVWETVLNDETYRRWTEPFAPGSHFKGDWSKGSRIQFFAPNDEGGTDGMVSTIAENRPPDFLSIRHLGIIKNGVEDTESEEVQKWTPAFENYTLREANGATEFVVDMDAPEEYMSMFEETWPKALRKLKEIAEEQHKKQ